MDGQKVQLLLTFPEYVKERMETTCYREKTIYVTREGGLGRGNQHRDISG